MSNATQCLIPDPDIGGIGVRVSFYIQSFVLVFLIACSFKDASGALWTLIATSIGLQTAALIQFGNGSLTLFQAVQVSNLTWMANFCIVIGLASYSRGRRTLEHDFLVQLGAMVEMYLSIGLSFALWIAAPNFRGDGCVDQTPFIFFWKSFKADKEARPINLVFVGLVAICYTYVTYTELKTRLNKYREKKKAESLNSPSISDGADGDSQIPMGLVCEPTSPRRTLPPLRHRGDTTNSIGDARGQDETTSVQASSMSAGVEDRDRSRRRHRNMPNDEKKRIAKRKGRKRNWQWSHLPPILFSIVFFETAVTAYFVAMNEILVQRGSGQASQWSFGQVLSLIVIFPSLVTLGQSIKERPWKEEKDDSDSQVPKPGTSSLSTVV